MRWQGHCLPGGQRPRVPLNSLESRTDKKTNKHKIPSGLRAKDTYSLETTVNLISLEKGPARREDSF